MRRFAKNTGIKPGASETLRGWFGVECREKVASVLQQAEREEHPPKECFSLLREFDALTDLSSAQRDWLVRNTSTHTLCLALKAGGTRVSEFLMEGAENREQLEKTLDITTNVRMTDAEAAQREMLKRAEEARKCM